MKQIIKWQQVLISNFSIKASRFLVSILPALLFLNFLLFFLVQQISAQEGAVAYLPATQIDSKSQIPNDVRLQYSEANGSIPVDHITGNPFNSDTFQLALLQGKIGRAHV